MASQRKRDGEPQIVERIEALKSSKDDAPGRLQQIAELDARLTASLLAFGRDVAIGRTPPAPFGQSCCEAARTLAGTLAHLAGGDLEKWVEMFGPRHPEYTALQDALVKLQGQREKGGWSAVPSANSGPDVRAPRSSRSGSGWPPAAI